MLFDTTPEKPKNIDVYADTVKYAVCRGRTCRKMLTWATVVASGASMCFTGKLDGGRDIVSSRIENQRAIWTIALEKNHWKDCPDRADFRRKR